MSSEPLEFKRQRRDGVKGGRRVIDAIVDWLFDGPMRCVVIPLYPGCQPLDVVGPREVFCGANEWMDLHGLPGERYEIVMVTIDGNPVRSESDMTLVPDAAIAKVVCGGIDTVLVPGGASTRVAGIADDVVEWLQSVECRRLTSVCTGTFLLASAGRCAGRRVTTHWAWAAELALRHADVEVDLDAIWIRDGELWTSAGVTAGIDLALAMVEEDCGAEVAQQVARALVVPVRRSGGQTQFSAPIWSEPPESAPIRAACDLIHHSPAGDLSVEIMARTVGLSTRHFTRRFRSEVGESPARYVERIRVEAARHLLETESVGLENVARQCGFPSAEVLRRAFHRQLGVSPASYRRQFALVPPRVRTPPNDRMPTAKAAS